MQMFKSLIALSLFGLLSFSVVACHNDPDTPHNEQEHKHHDEPGKAVIKLTPGTFATADAFDQSPQRSQFVERKDLPTVTYNFATGTDGWTMSTSTPAPSVLASHDGQPVYYSLAIEYFNAHGESLNGEFYEEGQDKVHQHFFSVFDNGQRVRDAAKLGFAYRYADQDPKGNHLGANNPLGLFGFIQFDGSRKAFDLNVQLMHARLTKYLADGKTAPFYAPTDQQIQQEDWEDFSVKLPIIVQ